MLSRNLCRVLVARAGKFRIQRGLAAAQLREHEHGAADTGFVHRREAARERQASHRGRQVIAERPRQGRRQMMMMQIDRSRFKHGARLLA